MDNVIQTARHVGIFNAYDHPGYTTEELRRWVKSGRHYLDLPAITHIKKCPNTLTSTVKLMMSNAVYPYINKLVLTSKATVPVDTETGYDQEDYIAEFGEASEFLRSPNQNPYTVGWNISTNNANGLWGSFLLFGDFSGDKKMINRALAGVTKQAGQAKLVVFTGSVVS